MTDATEGASTWVRLTRRKVVQWGLAYLAGAWALLQVLGFAADAFGWPAIAKQLAMLALAVGLPIALVLAWYHGDRGHQRITRSELAILTVLILLGGGALWLYGQRSTPAKTATASTATAPTATSGTAAPDARPSIAVLPFANRSDEQKDAFFVDGIHDDILTQLTKIGAMKVIARTSVEQFRDTKLTTKEIGVMLGVTRVLEGGVQRAGDRVRINVQLIDASTDAHLWAETYDRELTAANIFAIQTELAAAIAGALKAALTPAEKSRVKEVPTRNLEAWEAYQLGKQRIAKRTSTDLADAEQFFQKAIDLDPRFALAYVGLADTLSMQTEYSDTPFLGSLEQAQAAADTALKLDPGLSEAWVSSASVADYRAQYDRAEQMYRRAIELNPNYATAYHWLSRLQSARGREDDAVALAERAANLDPLSAVVQASLADVLRSQGRFSEAAAQYRRAIEIDPSMPGPYQGLGFLMAYALNRFADAVPLVQKAAELDPDNPGWSWSLANLHLDLGDESKSFVTIEQAAGRWPDDWGIQSLLAVIDQFRGDKAGTVRHAEHSLALYLRNPMALVLLRNADLQSGRDSDALARYQKAYPELFVQGAPRLNRSNCGVAVDLALVLQKRGDTARANVLLDGAAQAIGRIPRLGFDGMWLFDGYGIADVQIHALRGQKREALTALREAEKAGWRLFWRYSRDFDPALASIRNDPEFKAVFADIERDMTRQRAELAARAENAPLDLESVSRK